jgi:Cof subfamily protein (haloacid dehalogenase superfamily)
MESNTNPIKLIVLDIDGTLLNSKLEISARTERAIKAAMAEGVEVVLATGKTRHAGVHLVERLGLTSPGIYVQGVVIYEADGRIRYQQTLDPAIARQAITFGEDRGYQFIAYNGDRVMVRRQTPEVIDGMVKYHEPMPEAVGPLQNLLDSIPINKLLAVGDVQAIKALRWQLNAQLNGSVKLTQAAIPTMLEILPPGASKGAALRVLLKNMQLPAAQVMAIGDAENDIEMLQVAGLGVAMGNAEQKLKDVAKEIVASHDEDGVAEAIERFVLRRKLDEPVPDTAVRVVDTVVAPADPNADKPAAPPAAEAPKSEPVASSEEPKS